MRLALTRSGGFAAIPGLSRPVVVDTDELSPHTAERLRDAVAAAAVTDHPHASTPHAGAADMVTYRLHVTDDDGRETDVRFVDPIADPALQAVVDLLGEIDRSRR